MVHKLYLDFFNYLRKKKKKNYVLETFVSKKTKKKKTAGQTLGGTLTCVEQRGKRGPEKRSERE